MLPLTLSMQYFLVQSKQTNEAGVPIPLSDAETHVSHSKTNFSSSRVSSQHREQVSNSDSSLDPSTLVVDDMISCFRLFHPRTFGFCYPAKISHQTRHKNAESANFSRIFDMSFVFEYVLNQEHSCQILKKNFFFLILKGLIVFF